MKFRLSAEQSSNLFFTSDIHFDHIRIAIHRGFMSSEYSNKTHAHHEMKEFLDNMNHSIVTTWNETVPKNATIFILGDLSFSSFELTCKLLSKLNGNKILVLGNHDDPKMYARPDIKKYFSVICDFADIKVHDNTVPDESGYQYIMSSHYPMIVWNKSHYGSWMLHGHCHGNLKFQDNARRLDVGWDVFQRPVKYEELRELMKNRGNVNYDHHVE